MPSTLTRTQPLAAIPDPVSDYCARRLELDATRLRLDSHRPDNDLRKTQEIEILD